MFKNAFSLGERILPDYDTRDVGLYDTHDVGLYDTHDVGLYDTHDVGLYNSMAQTMKLKYCLFSKVSPVNHCRDMLNCSCKLFCLSNSYRCVGPKPCICFLPCKI